MDEGPVGLKERMDERFDDVDRRFGEVDKRMDERFERVDERFDRVDERFDAVTAEMQLRFKHVNEHLGRLDTDVRELRVDLKDMQRLMIQGFIGICTLMVTCFAILAGMIGF